MTTPAAATPGEAHELPEGRLAGFEGDEDELDLGSLMSRRAPLRRNTPTVEPAAAEMNGPDVPQLRHARQARNHSSSQSPADTGTSVGSDSPTALGGSTHPDLPSTTAGDARPVPPPKTERRAAPARRQRSIIRSSSVHVPVTLLDNIAAERQRTGRSNGEIVIVAIEHCHDRLGELLGQPQPTGRSLFQPRASRGARLSNGPLTALNVRLFEQDYAILDELVEEHRAFSRGHLVTTALTAYFDDQA